MLILKLERVYMCFNIISAKDKHNCYGGKEMRLVARYSDSY